MMLAMPFAGSKSMAWDRRRIAIGVAVSLAVHLLIVLADRHIGPAWPTISAPDRLPLTVRIVPPPPPPPPPVAQAAASPAPPAAPAAPRKPRRAPPPPVIAVPESMATSPDPLIVEQPKQAEPAPDAAPRFDMDAARRVAREHAHMRDPAKEGTALAQFPDPPLQTESTLARAISRAKRGICKDGIPGGLLAPLYLMMDKKDSGCKW